MGRLSNPISDITLIRNQLQIGFETITIFNTKKKKELKTVIDDFTVKLSEIGDDLECCLFYYAGHGIQHNEKNYLIPTNVIFSDERY